jgi:predicted transglutaminase-like cysteine proteinase
MRISLSTSRFNRSHEREHPGAFERRRRGDCEDFALWAWRKLAEVGVDAEF